MVAVGLVLLVLALIVGVVVALTNSDPASGVEAFGVTLDGATTGGLFLLGAAVGAVAMLGLALMLLGAIRARSRKRATRAEVAQAQGERETLAEHNARLQAELEQRRGAPAEPETMAAADDGTPEADAVVHSGPVADPGFGRPVVGAYVGGQAAGKSDEVTAAHATGPSDAAAQDARTSLDELPDVADRPGRVDLTDGKSARSGERAKHRAS